MPNGGTTSTRRCRNPGGDLDRTLDNVNVDQAVAGDQLLELGVGAVGQIGSPRPFQTTNFAASGDARLDSR
jgi:hypothetical protein